MPANAVNNTNKTKKNNTKANNSTRNNAATNNSKATIKANNASTNNAAANDNAYERNIEESKTLLKEIENMLRSKGSGSGSNGNGGSGNGGNGGSGNVPGGGDGNVPGGGGPGGGGGNVPGPGGNVPGPGGNVPGPGGNVPGSGNGKKTSLTIKSVGPSKVNPNGKNEPKNEELPLGSITTPKVRSPSRPEENVPKIPGSPPPPPPKPPSPNKRKALVTNDNIKPTVTKREENQKKIGFGPTPPRMKTKPGLIVGKTNSSKSASPSPTSNNQTKKADPTKKEIEDWKKANPGHLEQINKMWANQKATGKWKNKNVTANSDLPPSFVTEKIAELIKQKGGSKRRTRKRKSNHRTK